MAHRAALPSAKKIVKDNKSRLHIMTLWPVSLLAGKWLVVRLLAGRLLAGRLLAGRWLVGNELPYLPLMGGLSSRQIARAW